MWSAPGGACWTQAVSPTLWSDRSSTTLSVLQSTIPDPVTICIAGWLGRPDRLAAQIANCVPATYWWGRLRRVESWAPPEAEGVVPDARISVSEPGPGSGP